jgi:hypothetical protein
VVGESVGGSDVGARLGSPDGPIVGSRLGDADGSSVGKIDGCNVL